MHTFWFSGWQARFISYIVLDCFASNRYVIGYKLSKNVHYLTDNHFKADLLVQVYVAHLGRSYVAKRAMRTAKQASFQSQ